MLTFMSIISQDGYCASLSFLQPIDPYFSPIDINAQVKSVASLVREFDILVPQTISSDYEAIDIERSQALRDHSSDTCASSVSLSVEERTYNGTEKEQRNSVETSQVQPPLS